MVDFEAFPKKGASGILALFSELSQDLHGKGNEALHQRSGTQRDFDYAAVSAAADGVVLMNYDEHYPGTRNARSGRIAGMVRQKPVQPRRRSAGKADLRDRQLRLRLGAEAGKKKATSPGCRRQRIRAGGVACGARFRRGRGFRLRQPESPFQLPG